MSMKHIAPLASFIFMGFNPLAYLSEDSLIDNATNEARGIMKALFVLCEISKNMDSSRLLNNTFHPSFERF